MREWARPGVKCVCVKAPSTSDFRGILRAPAVGDVLTVREVFAGLRSSGDEAVALRFHEIINPGIDTLSGFMERGYWAEGFRPLVTQADDVARFAHLLVGQPTGVDA